VRNGKRTHEQIDQEHNAFRYIMRASVVPSNWNPRNSEVFFDLELIEQKTRSVKIVDKDRELEDKHAR
jgi:hypothetical protein